MSRNIEYSITNIEELKTNFEKNNSLILENLKKLEKEYNNMSEVLSTPNSNKIIPELYDIIKKYDDIVTYKGIYFYNVFKITIKEYNQFVNELSQRVEGGE